MQEESYRDYPDQLRNSGAPEERQLQTHARVGEAGRSAVRSLGFVWAVLAGKYELRF